MKTALLAPLGAMVVTCAAQAALLVDFNSNQNAGGTPAVGNPADPANAAHNESGYQSYHASHEVAADFITANYDATFVVTGAATVSLTPTWPNTSANTVQQSIGRSQGQANTWIGNNVNLLRDWIGIDSRTTAPGGNGPWNGATGTPTYMHLTLGGLPAAEYTMTTFHHDVENMNSFFTLEISTDGGTTFGMTITGRMTNSLAGGTPAENEILSGTAPNIIGGNPASLSSTLNLNFTADGTQDVVLRFAPRGPADATTHQMFFGINGFQLEQFEEDPDRDGDGLPTHWEVLHSLDPDDNGLNPNNLGVPGNPDNGAAGDPDMDNLSNADEFANGTNPRLSDTDDDGVNDGQEVADGTNPLLADTDNDGLSDGEEASLGTNPLLVDTDGDGVGDGTEVANGTDPLDPESPALADLLCAYWPLDVAIGVGLLVTPDEGPGGYDLTLTNMDAANFVSDEGRVAASFDNSAQTLLSRVHLPGEELPINRHAAFTVSMWVKVNGTGQNDLRFFSEGSTTTNTPLFNLGTRNNGTDGVFDIFLRGPNNATPNHQYSLGQPLDGTWHHTAVTVDQQGRKVTLYVDGILDRDDFIYQNVFGPELDTTSVGGILRAAASHWVTGLVDDVSLWKAALPPETIAALASGENPLDLAGAPRFAITAVTRNAISGDVTLTWNSRPGKNYVVRFSPDLVGDPRTWPDLTDSWPSQGETTTYTDDTTGGVPVRYYVIEQN